MGRSSIRWKKTWLYQNFIADKDNFDALELSIADIALYIDTNNCKILNCCFFLRSYCSTTKLLNIFCQLQYNLVYCQSQAENFVIFKKCTFSSRNFQKCAVEFKPTSLCSRSSQRDVLVLSDPNFSFFPSLLFCFVKQSSIRTGQHFHNKRTWKGHWRLLVMVIMSNN